MSDASDFVTCATPFEISVRLSEMGVNTGYQEFAREFFLEWESSKGVDQPAEATRALAEKWSLEIEQRRGFGTNFREFALLAEIADFYRSRIKGLSPLLRRQAIELFKKQVGMTS